jgi:hypothetical protein
MVKFIELYKHENSSIILGEVSKRLEKLNKSMY